jgi:hypothetical protein
MIFAGVELRNKFIKFVGVGRPAASELFINRVRRRVEDRRQLPSDMDQTP